MMKRLITLSSVVMPEDTTQVVAKGVEGAVPVGVVAAAEVARGMSPREGSMMTLQVQAETTNRNRLPGMSPNDGDVGRKHLSDPSVKRSSAKDAEEPGTGSRFAHA